MEGYTDNRGPKDTTSSSASNARKRCKRYLYEKYQIPLHKINVISYGAEKPVAPNTTRDGRAKNRRVVIKRARLARLNAGRDTAVVRACGKGADSRKLVPWRSALNSR